MAKGKPVILNDYRSQSEEAFEFNPEAFMAGQNIDSTYIPGYSEIVKANDIEKADDLQFQVQHQKTGITKQKLYKLVGADPRPLPFVFRWLRATGVDGTVNSNVARDLLEYTRKERGGYRIVNWFDDEEKLFKPNGWGFPPAARLDRTDGTIRLDDLALYVVDGRAERAWENWVAEHTRDMESNPGSPDGVPMTVDIKHRTETVSIGE